MIDAENYLILARTGSCPELHDVAREEAVGITDAKRVARRLRKKHQDASVEVFWVDGFRRILENA